MNEIIRFICSKCGKKLAPTDARPGIAYFHPVCGGYTKVPFEDKPKAELSPSKKISQKESALQKCPQCKSSNSSAAIYCRKCGKRLIEKTFRTVTYCEKCESEYADTDEYCEKDGTKLIQKSIEIKPEPAKSTDSRKNSQNSKSEKLKGKALGFKLATIWVVAHYLGAISSIGLAIYIMYDSGESLFLTIALLSIPSAMTAYGVFMRKRWGLIVTYVYLAFGFVGALVYFPDEPGLATINWIIVILWYFYFSNRSNQFQ